MNINICRRIKKMNINICRRIKKENEKNKGNIGEGKRKTCKRGRR
jgi:hypothetical protein